MRLSNSSLARDNTLICTVKIGAAAKKPNQSSTIETSWTPLQQSLGPLRPKCSRECLTHCARIRCVQRSVPSVHRVSQTLSGHFLDIGAPLWARRPPDTPEGGRRCLNSNASRMCASSFRSCTLQGRMNCFYSMHNEDL